jgi:hypothetical protein
MHITRAFACTSLGLLILGTATTVLAWQLRPFREYPGVEYENFPLPPDYREQTEWVFARLMYPAVPVLGFRGNPDWKHGSANWTIDYPRSDRHVSEAIRRLSRIHVRSVEQPVDLDDGDDVYNYPWLYAVEVGYWRLTDDQVKKLREYLDRGGFFMVDDFHDVAEWRNFVFSMNKVYPNRPITDIPNDNPIFHTIYDLDKRYQVPGAQYLMTGRIYEQGGIEPKWRAIYDDKGRIVVAICHNMDLGDSWEHADEPEYDEKFSSLGFKIAVNYVTYSMTH